MAISTAVQKGSSVHFYDERNHHIFSHTGELYGFTGSSVSIKKGSSIHVYDEKGHHTASHPVRK